MHSLKTILSLLLLISCNTHASDNIKFSTTLGYGQEEERVTLTFDTGEICELHVKQGADSTSYDSCIFQLTKQIHTVSIKGETRYKNEGQVETESGTGEDTIINLRKEFDLLNNASNIDELFAIYNTAITYINSELPPAHHVAPLTFTGKETRATIHEHQTKYDIALPHVYIKMISDYGYPQFFIPLSEQRSINDIYQNDWGYSTDQYNHHKGIEKNKVFFQKHEDVFYLFHDETRMRCNNEPVVDYTIATEGGYQPIDVANINIEKDCGQFFNFLKEHIIERFQFQASIHDDEEPTPTLSLFGDDTFEAELNSSARPSGFYYYFN